MRTPEDALALSFFGDFRAPFKSNAYVHALERAERYARFDDVTLLIEGESGTGKTILARRIHALSSRAHRPYHSVTLSSVDDSLASSELFGHVAGAFTDARTTRAGVFVTASGGTLLLDEIGKASETVQRRLLHAVEANLIRPVGSDRDVRIDVRLIAASNVPLQRLAETGAFLPDLYARLETFRVHLPPLRERRADIPDLVVAALHRHAAAAGYTIAPDIAPELMVALQRADWPNNLRQLDATVHRLLIEAEGRQQLTLGMCTEDLVYLQDPTAELGSLTDERVASAMEKARSKSEAAALLGVHRTTLYRFQKRTGPPPEGSGN